MIFMIGAHGVVTGYTGDRLAGVGLKNIRPYRMGKFSLGLMALNTDGITTSPEKAQVFAAMGLMAGGTFFDRWVREFLLAVALKGLRMAGLADLTFIVLQ